MATSRSYFCSPERGQRARAPLFVTINLVAALWATRQHNHDRQPMFIDGRANEACRCSANLGRPSILVVQRIGASHLRRREDPVGSRDALRLIERTIAVANERISKRISEKPIRLGQAHLQHKESGAAFLCGRSCCVRLLLLLRTQTMFIWA